jgi:hypothetical protein
MPPQEKPILVSEISEKRSRNIRKNLEESFAALENKNEHDIRIVAPTAGKLEAFHKNWQTMQPVSTKQRWLGLKTDRICVQFNGIYEAEKKNPTTAELVFIMRELTKKYKLIPMGLPLTIEQSIRELAASALFVGCSSGMGHVAVCTGIPTIIFLPKAVESFRPIYTPLKNVTIVETAEELIKEVNASMTEQTRCH